MNQAVRRISLDVHDISSQISINAKRGDTGRSILATLTESGRPYEITRDCSVEFVAYKPDGNVLKNSCKVLGNVILYDFTDMTVNVSGAVDCEFRVFDGSGKLLTSPRFGIIVEGTLYSDGDAVEQETTNFNTVKSANTAYAEVYMWSDGNPDAEDRSGYFVTADTSRSGAMICKATASSEIRGVTMHNPGFASNAAHDKFDASGKLLKQFSYVALHGFVPVVDNGRCAVNKRCMPGNDGTAVPAKGSHGYLVVDRLDKDHAVIMLVELPDITEEEYTALIGMLDGGGA